jgi:hypothetical protein
MPGRAGKSWQSAPSQIAGGAGCLLEHASTSTGQVNGSGSYGQASEVFLVLEAGKVGGRTPDGFWTALDGSAQVLRGGAGAMACYG